jgi:hypothetical protein
MLELTKPIPPDIRYCAAIKLTVPGVNARRDMTSLRLDILTQDGLVDPDATELALKGIVFQQIDHKCGQCEGTCIQTNHPDGTADGFITPKCKFFKELQQMDKIDDQGYVK